jgi:lipoic acid synthetase
MVLGGTCTRNCRFCSVSSGHPERPDVDEPEKVAEAIRRMGLRHAVITMVTRDDLNDGGAGHVAATVRAVRSVNSGTTIEVLIADFRGETFPADLVLESRPDVFGHNIETVERLYESIRGRRCTYQMALGVLRRAANHPASPIVKSALMVGHGETPEEVRQTLTDLRHAGCEAVCIGQYLRPTPKQRRVVEYVHEDQFRTYEQMARDLGFSFAVAGPFVRSSYRSEELVRAPFAKGRLQAV